MEREEFDALVRRLQAKAAEHPQQFRSRVRLLAWLGYGYVLLMLVLIAAALAAIVYSFFFTVNWLNIKLALVLLILCAITLRSLWVRFEAPRGVRLRPGDAPQLFAEVERIRATLDSAPVHRILLTGEANAAMVQHPRLGILGWPRNYLVCGLPLMLALSPQQFAAIVAHEMGHLSGNHGRFGAWIYRVNRTWEQLCIHLQGGGLGAWMFGRFARWYAPQFNACSFVLQRHQEYEADRAAAQIAGNVPSAEALLLTHSSLEQAIDRFWTDVAREIAHSEVPPSGLLKRMGDALRTALPQQEARSALRAALTRETDTLDTHPCLAERLAALEYPLPVRRPVVATGAGSADATAAPTGSTIDAPATSAVMSATTRFVDRAHADADDDENGNGNGTRTTSFDIDRILLPPPPAVSAAEHYLGENLPRLVQLLEIEWMKLFGQQWTQHHAEAKVQLSRLDELEARLKDGAATPLTRDESIERALLIESHRNEDECLEAMRQILAEDQDCAAANMTVGRLLLARDDPAGVAMLERAMKCDPTVSVHAYGLLYDFYLKRGRRDDAQTCLQNARKWQEQLELAAAERGVLAPDVELVAHDVDAPAVQKLADAMAQHARVKQAYLMKRIVRHLPEVPCRVLLVVPKYAFFQLSDGSADQKLAQQLVEALPLPQDTWVWVLGDGARALRKRVKSQGHGLIYER